MSRKKRKSGEIPMEFPSRRHDEDSFPEADEIICQEAFNSNHHSSVNIDNITEVIAADADKRI